MYTYICIHIYVYIYMYTYICIDMAVCWSDGMYVCLCARTPVFGSLFGCFLLVCFRVGMFVWLAACLFCFSVSVKLSVCKLV